jgi:hypothetical protein
MRGALLIAMREVRGRRAVLGAALVAGLVPLLSPLLPGVAAGGAAEAREVMAGILSLSLGLLMALVLGASALSSDLAENRLGFDFARPVGALSIWTGRLAAAVGVTALAMVIVLIPVTLVRGRLPSGLGAGAPPAQWLAFGAALLLAVGLAHVAGVAIRSRSRWLALDLAGLVVVTLLVASAVRRFHEAFALQTANAAILVAALAAIPALWMASAIQVVRGRTDIVLGHRAQSIALWSMMGALGLGLSGYSIWFVAVGVNDLAYVWPPTPALAGPWLTLAGRAAGRPGLVAQFLFDPESGRSLRVGPTDFGRQANELVFSRDGRRAVWYHREHASDPTISVTIVDLDGPVPKLGATSIELELLMTVRPALSPSGARLATLQGHSLSVHDLASGQILAAVTLGDVEQDWVHRYVTFVDENRVRVYSLKKRLTEYELEIDRRALTSWTGPEFGNGSFSIRWRADHERVILHESNAAGVVLLDGRTGATIARLGPPDEMSPTRAGFLADGRIVKVAESSPGSATLEVLSPDGVRQKSFPLARGTVDPSIVYFVGGEATPGTVVVSRTSKRNSSVLSEDRLMLVDVETGKIRDVDGTGWPVAALNWIVSEPPLPGSPASRMVARDGAVWLIDPETAKLKLIAGRTG